MVHLEIPDIVSEVMSEINEMDPDELIENMPDFVEFFFEGFSSIAESNEEVQEVLEDIGEAVLNYRIILAQDNTMETYMEVKDGKVSGGTGNKDNADFTIEMPMETMLGMASGEADMVGEFMSGKIKIEGNMVKAMSMMPLMEVMDEIFHD